MASIVFGLEGVETVAAYILVKPHVYYLLWMFCSTSSWPQRCVCLTVEEVTPE